MGNVLFILHPDQDAATLHKVTDSIRLSAESANVGFSISHWDSRESQIDKHASAFVVFLGAGTVLARLAVSELLEPFASDAGTAVVYADVNSLRLPDYSPQRLQCQNYMGQLVTISAEELEKVGGLSPRYLTYAAVYDLLLRLSVQNLGFVHINTVLAHSSLSWFGNVSEAEIEESRTAITSARNASGGGDAGDYLGDRAFSSRGVVRGNPLVSIVIPTQALSQSINGVQQSLIVNAVRSIVELTDYPHYEIVAVVDESAEQGVLDQLQELAGDRLQIVRWNKPFNFSQKMNFGVLHARGEFVLLLNDDVLVLTPEWLRSMLVLAQLPNAGMAGAMLYYEDDTIQHAGHAYYQGSPTHIGLELPRGSRGPDASFMVEREVSGVTAACALMPLDVFKKVGGFTALLPGNFNDVDLCLKVGWSGYDIYWTPDAELYHFESKTRDAHVHYYELDVIEHRWGLRLDDSRFWPLHPAAAN
jgi:O-antigen biosynthesis protein